MGNNMDLAKPANLGKYNKNYKSLKKYYPHYLKELDNTQIYKNFYTLKTGKNDVVNLYSIEHDSFYYDVNDPRGDAANNIEILNLKNLKLGVMFGIGLSYELDYIAKKILPQNNMRALFIFEKEWEIFKLTLHYVDLTQLIENKKIVFFIGEKEEDLLVSYEAYFRGYGEALYYLKSLKFIYHSTNFSWFKDYYMDMIQATKKAVMFILMYYGNDPDDSLIGIENMLDNIDEILENPGINLIYDKFKNKPAIIVATGPSLNKNKHLLKGIEDKALIIAADASLKVMMKDNIKPHLVTALERQGRVDQLLKGFEKEEVEDIYFAGTPVIQNKVYKIFPAPRLIVYRNFDHFKWLGIEKGTLNIKQSSGNMAFKIAEALGCNPIILIGQDLAYSRDGYTHADGATLGDKQEFTSGDFEVMGNDGTPIMTNNTWNNFKIGYELDMAESDKRCINCTEGGAFIKGTEVMPLQEAIDKFVQIEINPLDIIRESIKGFSQEDIDNDRKHLKQLFVNTEKDLRFMMKEALDSLNMIVDNKLELEAYISGDSSDDKLVKDLFNKTIMSRKKIFGVQPTFQLYLMHVVQSYNIKFENDVHAIFDEFDDEIKSYSKIVLANAKWFAIFHDITSLSLEALKIGKNKI